ncbi:Ras-related protein ced-10 [Nosema granulosis]|uniref:Ras-related protein ced-10 n=1 Tax=Nosema granulosis TaxID=83296 RepID=A0A9P6GYP3_9MICR|nr:Ras-related protein ced-10 [Nosema granulosis]
MKTIKVVVLGDKSVGKSWLVTTFVTGRNPGGYIPTLFDNYGRRVEYKNKLYTVSIWDTTGNSDFTKMRTISLQQADVFILCYAINNVISFNNIKKWLEPLKEFEKPIVLCATKADLKDEDYIDIDVTEDIVRKNELFGYVETSAIEFTNVNRVFNVAIEAVINPKKLIKGRYSCFGLFTCC